MPLRRLPSLSALRAFEAAGRRLSFKAAAEELAVTPGAISQQIRSLEDDLGVALFNRAPRSVSLTSAGASLLPELSEAFLTIREAVDRVRPKAGRELTICMAGIIMRNWLFPRLHDFASAHPDVKTNVRAVGSWADHTLAENEVGFWLTDDPPAHLHARKIHKLMLIPLASPEFIARHKPESPADVLRLPLLEEGMVHRFAEKSAWELWFDAAGLPGPVPPFSMTFDWDAADYAFDMALAGNGIMLGWSIQCFQALAEGRLQCPFGPIVELDQAYHVMCQKSQAGQPHIKAFMDWVEEEAALLTTLRSLQSNAA